MTTRATFVVNGLGLGNSTRCHAVIQRLAERGCAIDVVTMGNGTRYFQSVPEVDCLTAIDAFDYASEDGSVSAVGTLRNAGAITRTHRSNHATLVECFRARPPDVVVLDSIYDVRAARKVGVPVVALNNSDVTLAGYRAAPVVPASIRAHFYGVELWDFAFHRCMPDAVVSPSLDPRVPEVASVFRRVNPIVRRGFGAQARSGGPTRAVIMPSGSSFGLRVDFRSARYPVALDVVGTRAPSHVAERDDVRHHGPLADPLPVLARADLAVINGGFSAVSEMASLRIPMVVVPVPGHAEQWVNARTVVALGLGRMATQATWESTMLAMLEDLTPYREAASRLSLEPAGAERAADIVLDVALRRHGRLGPP